MAANDANEYRDADTGPNDTAERTETDADSAGGPEPTGAETAGALGAPTPSSNTQQATEDSDS